MISFGMEKNVLCKKKAALHCSWHRKSFYSYFENKTETELFCAQLLHYAPAPATLKVLCICCRRLQIHPSCDRPEMRQPRNQCKHTHEQQLKPIFASGFWDKKKLQKMLQNLFSFPSKTSELYCQCKQIITHL